MPRKILEISPKRRNPATDVQLEVDIKPEDHPWQQFAGMFADDPDWEAFQASIQKYREDVDRDSYED